MSCLQQGGPSLPQQEVTQHYSYYSPSLPVQLLQSQCPRPPNEVPVSQYSHYSPSLPVQARPSCPDCCCRYGARPPDQSDRLLWGMECMTVTFYLPTKTTTTQKNLQTQDPLVYTTIRGAFYSQLQDILEYFSSFNIIKTN